MAARSGELPGWVNLGLLAAAQPRGRVRRLRADRGAARREPARGGRAAAVRRLRLRGGGRLHAVLRDELHLHRARGRDRLPLRPVQHRRRGPGLSRRARRRARRPLSRLAAVAARGAARDPRGRRLRRALGLHPGLAAGAARQPHRDHHDHVQLHRRGADDLPAGQRADQAGPADPGIRHDGAERLASADARAAGRARHRGDALAAQPVVPVRALVLPAVLAVRLADALRLCVARGRPEREPRRSMAGSRRRARSCSR